MINLPILPNIFLNDYWQKKFLVIREAIPNFTNFLTADELAGLALEEDVESRIVCEIKSEPYWQLKRGPFTARDFAKLPKTHWTLLVQGVDRLIPEVAALFDHFQFIPQWRIDDIMISYAVERGSVGPHYDNYDVFLYQAAGRRKWQLTTQNCIPENYMTDVELRIMQEFTVEEEIILEEGDMLYLPAHVGHYGISLSENCMTYSFGYRSYPGQELLDSFADYLSLNKQSNTLYQDPNWNGCSPGMIPSQAWRSAQRLLENVLKDEEQFKRWFGCFVTQLDAGAEQLVAQPSKSKTKQKVFFTKLKGNGMLRRDPVCRFAFEESGLFFVNGTLWDILGVDLELIREVSNHRLLSTCQLHPYLNSLANSDFLYLIWSEGFLEWVK